jgi:hypothetical protein
VKRTFLAVLGAALLIGCTTDSSRGPLAPSGASVTSVQQISWACLTEPGPGCGAVSAGAQLSGTPAGDPGPSNFTAIVSGSTVTLTWQLPPGVTPTHYLIEVGSATGRSDIAVLLFQATGTSLTVTNVPSNIYFVRLRAIVNNCCATDPSAEIVVRVGTPPPGCTPAISPTTARVPAAGGTVTITVTADCAWTAITNSPFLTITSGSSGFGNGTVTVSAARNPGSNRAGTVTIAGLAVTITQDASTLVASFELFDPSTQSGPTTECRFTGSPTTCQLRSGSFTFGGNFIVSYEWTVQYTYGVVKTLSQTSSSPTFSFSDSCGGDTSEPSGPAQALSVTLTVTDNIGDTATAVSGSGNQPPLIVRLFSCP